MTNVKTLNDQQLVQKIKFLISEEHKNISAQIALLKEVRQRKLALAMGYPNLLEFCVSELGLTRDQSWKRSQAAGAVAKEPELLNLLKSGKTSVSTLALISPKLTEKTADEIKKFIPERSKREVEAFVSNLNRDGTRAPKPETVKVILEVDLATLTKLDQARRLLKQNRTSVSREDVLAAALEVLLDKKDPARKALRAERRQLKKNEVQTAMGQRQVKVETTKQEVQTATGQQQQVKVEIEKLEVQTASEQQQQQEKEEHKKMRVLKRYIPAKIRHSVLARTDRRCQFVSREGRHCQETRVLQLDHIKMFCLGGTHEPDNLRLLCASHNQYVAEMELGRNYS